MNFLEELVAEWYEFQGYFVRRNVLVGRRAKGGYECELDVVAFHPGSKHLVHIEPSMDAQSWAKRDERFTKKFAAGRRHIPELFSGLELPEAFEQIALLGFASNKNRSTVGGGKLLLVDELLREILTSLKDRRIASSAVPEDKPILRTLQYVAEHREVVAEVLGSER
jgi:hypothetical protein